MLFRPLAVVLAVFLVQAVSPADAQVTLKLKFTEGATYKFRNAQKVVQTIGLGEKTKFEGKSDVTMTTTMVCGQRDEEQNLTYKTTFDSIVAELQGFGTKVKFDSAKLDVKSENELFAAALDNFRKMFESTLAVTLDKDNQFVSVEGGFEQGAELYFDEIKTAFVQSTNRFPTAPVKKGDTWERTEEVPLGQGQTFVLHRKYQYAGTLEKGGAKLDKITATDLSVDYVVKDEDAPIKVKE
ncbi:MAG TPA: hypothetical protein VND64_08735, partial [Pirellulales bacterium]|nr:hypothetical protein [Pirellulales bacterium]